MTATAIPTPSGDDARDAKAQREAIVKEYSQYVATSAIAIDGVRAYNAGDPVPASAVADGIVGKDLVTSASAKKSS